MAQKQGTLNALWSRYVSISCSQRTLLRLKRETIDDAQDDPTIPNPLLFCIFYLAEMSSLWSQWPQDYNTRSWRWERYRDWDPKIGLEDHDAGWTRRRLDWRGYSRAPWLQWVHAATPTTPSILSS